MRRLAPAVLAACLALAGRTAGAQTLDTAPAATPCLVVDAALDDALDSATARVGRRFRFTVAAGAPRYAGARGVGIVDAVKGAKRGGAPGELAIETRFVEADGAAHVPALLLAIGGRRTALTEGSRRDAPAVLSVVGVVRPTPYQVVAGLAGAYGFLHFGGQAELARGTPLRLVLGDELLSDGCTLPAGR